MALDKTTGSPRSRRGKRRQQPTTTNPEAIPDRPLPALIHPPKGKPVPVLERNGFTGDIHEFNQRVQRITDAHERATGLRPNPGLVLDIARSPVNEDIFDKLFDLPTKRIARYAGIAAKVITAVTQDDFVSQINRAGVDGNLQQFLDDHIEELSQAMDDPEQAPAVRKAIHRARTLYWSPQKLKEVEALRAKGLNTEQGGFGAELQKGVAGLGKTVQQISTALVLGVPMLAYAEGKAVYRSGKERSLSPLAETQVELARTVIEGVHQDFTNPEENPGFLFLDILGILSGGFGAGARVAAATKTRSVRALAKRPVPDPIAYRKGEMVEFEQAFENAFARQIQKWVAHRRNKQLADEFPQARGAVSLIRPLGLQDAITKQFSPETKMGRLARVRRRYEHIMEQLPRRELEFAAGAAASTKTLHQKIPRKMRRGLTVGEQKLIQVIATDDPTPFLTWRRFHENMIDLGINPKEHSAQLLALDLAERVLKKPPSERLAKVIPLVRQVVAEREVILADELGVLPHHVAPRRVAAAGEVVREGAAAGSKKEVAQVAERISDGGEFDRLRADSFYLPFFSRTKTRKETRSEIRLQAGVRPGQYGIPLPELSRLDPSLRHVFSGKSIIAGDFRIDATNLAGESYGRAVRLSTVLNEHKRLLGAAKDTKRSEFDIPIRDKAGVPDKLKAVLSDIEEGVLTQEQIDSLGNKPVDDLLKHLFPDDTQIDGVKWVDSRLVLDVAGAVPEASGLWRSVQFGGQMLNEVFRVPTLFLRPAYALNILSNTGMLAFQQGPFMVNNLARALYSRKLYGDRVTLALDELAGGGKSRSMVNLDMEAKALAGGRAIAQFWHTMADGWMRRAALIHEIQRRGYKGRQGFEEFLFDKTKRGEIQDAARRGNKAMVEFNNLTQLEKAALRNFIFVYPWVSRSAVWSIRTLVEHPIKSTILAQLGEDVREDFEDVLARSPEWFQRSGYFPIGWSGDGNPIVINPAQLSAFGTVGELAPLATGLFAEQRPYTAINDILGPAARFTVMAASGRDEFGNELPGPDFITAVKEVALTLPQVRAYERGKAAKVKLPPLDVTNRETLVRRQNAALEKIALTPGWLGGWGMLVTGGLTPREVNQDALIARYWRDQPMAERHENEMVLIRKVLRMQAKLLGRNLPPKVREAVDQAGEVDLRLRQIQAEQGRNPTDLERDTVLIDTLRDNKKIGEKETERLLKLARGLRLEKEHEAFRRNLNARFGGKALAEWDEAVRIVASFTKPVLQRKINVLAREGLIPGANLKNVNQEALYEVGRKYLKFKEEADRRNLLARELTGPEGTVANYDDLVWEDAQDKPVKVGDVALPSFVRLEWAHKTAPERAALLATSAKASWNRLPALVKELLGKKPPPKMAEAWRGLEQAKAEYRDTYLGANVTRDQIHAAVRQLEKRYPGFLQEYLFDQQAVVRRFEVLAPYRNMPPDVRREYEQSIAAPAKQIVAAIASGNYENTQLRETWRMYVRDTLKPWIAEQLALARYLEPFGPSFVEGLISP